MADIEPLKTPTAPVKDGRVNNGGARPNSGPKPKAVKFENEITKADKRIAKNLIRFIENMERLADGILLEETNPRTGATRVYTTAPDRQANEYLINRIMGKPTERTEHSGNLTLKDAVSMTDDDLDTLGKERGLW